MSDKPPKDDNVVKLPQNDMSVQRLGLLTTQQRQEAHKNLTEGLDKAYSEIDKNQQLDSIVLIRTLDKFSTTPDYDKRVIRMIKRIRKLEEDNK